MNKKISIDKEMCAQRIKKIRKEYGYSQESMAELLNISLSAYTKIESGENNVSVNVLTEIKKKFRVNSDYILYGEQITSDEGYNLFINSDEINKLKLFIRILLYYSEMKKVINIDEISDDQIKLILNILNKDDKEI